MSEQYAPTMERLRFEYVEMRADHFGFADLYADEWDRALAAHDREVAAETLREVAALMDGVPNYRLSEYDRGREDQRHIHAEAIYRRAAEIEKGADQ